MNTADGNLELQQPKDSSVNEFILAKSDPVAAAIYRGWSGIPWAGGFYGMAFVVVVASVDMFVNGGFPIGIGLLICFIPFFFGALIGTFTGIISAYLCWVFHRNFYGLICGRTAVSMSGGLAGFLSTFWAGFIIFGQTAVQTFNFGSALYLAFVLGAILSGQVGSLYCASTTREWNQMVSNLGQDTFQFEIKHLLILFIWISVVLCLNQATENNYFLFSVCFYVVAQFVLIVLDRRVYFMRMKNGVQQKGPVK